MNRIWPCALVVVCVMLTISACAPNYSQPESSCPTLPSFQEEQTPVQQLQQGIDKTKQEQQFTIDYGTIRQSGLDCVEDTYSSTVSEENPLDWDALRTQVPYFPNKDTFLSDFCNQPLHAIPSNTGIVRYQLTALSWENARELLYQQAPEGNHEGTNWSIIIELDSAGRFSRLEITIEAEEELCTAFLSITFPDAP